MKKKISILATAALCVTMGTVYATWTYAQNAANSLDDVAISKQLGTAETIAKGDIVEVSNNLTLSVDKAADDNYKALLSITGSLVVKFEPDALATEDTIALQFEITGNVGTYNDNAIFVLPATLSIGENSTWTIDGTNLGITMNDISLGTYDEYQVFAEAFDEVSLTITFSEVTA